MSVIDVQRALAGDPEAEFFRIPVQAGPFGIAVSPDGKYVATANRESQQIDLEGNTISIIDKKSVSGPIPGHTRNNRRKRGVDGRPGICGGRTKRLSF